MMRQGVRASVAAILVGCASPGAATEAVASGAGAGAPSAGLLADAGASSDAGAAGPPRCTSGRQVVYDAAPDRLGGMAFVGDTLYVSRYVRDLSDRALEGVVYALDRRTGVPIAEVMRSAGGLFVSQGDGAALVSDGASIWTVGPDHTPTLLVAGRTRAGFATTDASWVYWLESDTVYAQPRAGGAPRALLSCTGGLTLMVADEVVYCGESYSVRYASADGAATGTLSTGPYGYPVVGLAIAGADLYVAKLVGTLVRVPLGGGVAEELRSMSGSGHTYGMLLTPTHILTTGYDTRLFDRATRTEVTLTHVHTDGAPRLVGGDLYLSSPPAVLRCID